VALAKHLFSRPEQLNAWMRSFKIRHRQAPRITTSTIPCISFPFRATRRLDRLAAEDSDDVAG
jgi:hypothetical protein